MSAARCAGRETTRTSAWTRCRGCRRPSHRSVSGGLVSLTWQAPTTGGPITRYLIEATTPVGPFRLRHRNAVARFPAMRTHRRVPTWSRCAGNATGFGVASAPVVVVVPRSSATDRRRGESPAVPHLVRRPSRLLSPPASRSPALLHDVRASICPFGRSPFHAQ